MSDDGSNPMDYIDRGSEKNYLGGVDSASFVNLVLKVGGAAIIGIVARYVVVASVQVHIRILRAQGISPYGTMQAAAAIPGNDDDNDDDDDDDDNGGVERHAEALNHRRGGRNLHPAEKSDAILKFVTRVFVLFQSVYCFARVFGKAIAAAAGSELPLSGYILIATLFSYIFTRELFPQFGTCIEQKFEAFYLGLQRLLAFLGASLSNVKRVLLVNSRAIRITMRNMLRAVGQIDRNTIWGAGSTIWSTIGAVGVPAWNKTCVVVRIIWNAMCDTLNGIWSPLRAAGNSFCCTIWAALSIVWTPLWASRGVVWSTIWTTCILLLSTICSAAEVLCVTIFFACMLLWFTIGAARDFIWAPLWAVLRAVGSAIVMLAGFLKAQVVQWREATRPEFVEYDEEPIYFPLSTQIQLPCPAELAASVRQMTPRTRGVPECTPQLAAGRFVSRTEGRSFVNNWYDSDTRGVAGSRFRRKEGVNAAPNAAGFVRYCESFTFLPGNLSLSEIPARSLGQRRQAMSSLTAVDGHRDVERRIAEKAAETAASIWGRGRRRGKRWRKLQRLVSQNTDADFLLDFFPSGGPRTRPAPHRYPRPTVRRSGKGAKRRVMEASLWYKEMTAKIRLYPDPMYCSDAVMPLSKKVKLMGHDQALRTMAMEFANRPLVFEGSEVHCCTVDAAHKRELWVHAKFLDDSDSKKTAPGGLTYLPVTLLRPSFNENLTGQGPKWYVQPGGWQGRVKWAGEESRVIWEVPQDILFNKVRAAHGETCDTCHRDGQRCSWVPGMVERFCDDCADAPRQRHLKGCTHSRDLGFKWVKACNCQGV